MEEKDPNKVKAGKARSAKMSKEERSEIARRAAEARWQSDIPKAAYEGEIPLAEDVAIPCAVLEDGTRVITQRGMFVALGRHKNPSKSTIDEKPAFIAANNLNPFISSELRRSWEPVNFRLSKGSGGVGGNIAIGYDANILPLVCDVFDDAERAGVLKPNQAHIANAARVISRGFRKLGIIALIDEVTGYQDDRAKDALAKILETYIADEYQQWTKTFPERFYREMFRLRGWDWTEKSIRGCKPGVVGRYTDDIVYERLAPSILKELRKKNPTIKPGRRSKRHFQWLTGDIGHPRLMAHLEGVTLLMRQSRSWSELKDKLDEFYPIHEITPLGIKTNVKRKKIGSGS